MFCDGMSTDAYTRWRLFDTVTLTSLVYIMMLLISTMTSLIYIGLYHDVINFYYDVINLYWFIL